MELTIETKIKLNDGHLMPQLGLGVWQTRAGATCEAAVLATRPTPAEALGDHR